MATAAARAAHLVVDREPWIFEDRLAAALLGGEADELLAPHRDSEVLGTMRVAMTARCHYAEVHLLDAVRRGIEQYVLLGAGLDSFAYRSPLARQLHVFEVDHPATQAWKRQCLEAASIPAGDRVRFVAVDFTLDSLAECLHDAGFDHARPAFVSWLGVTQYLTGEAIGATLDVLGGLRTGSELVMEYLVPAVLRDEGGQALADFFMPRAAAAGEPWLTFLTPAEARATLAARGMEVVDDADRRQQVDPALWMRSDGLRPHRLGRVIRAVVA